LTDTFVAHVDAVVAVGAVPVLAVVFASAPYPVRKEVCCYDNTQFNHMRSLRMHLPILHNTANIQHWLRNNQI